MVPKGAPKTGVDVSKGGGGKSKGQKSMDDFVHDLEQRAPKMDAKAKKKDAKKYVCSKTKRVSCSFECYKVARAAN